MLSCAKCFHLCGLGRFVFRIGIREKRKVRLSNVAFRLVARLEGTETLHDKWSLRRIQMLLSKKEIRADTRKQVIST